MSSSSAKASLSICTTLYQVIYAPIIEEQLKVCIFMLQNRDDYRQLPNGGPWQHLQAPRLGNIVTLAQPAEN